MISRMIPCFPLRVCPGNGHKDFDAGLALTSPIPWMSTCLGFCWYAREGSFGKLPLDKHKYIGSNVE